MVIAYFPRKPFDEPGKFIIVLQQFLKLLNFNFANIEFIYLNTNYNAFSFQMLCAAITTFGSGGFTPGAPVSTHTFLKTKEKRKIKLKI